MQFFLYILRCFKQSENSKEKRFVTLALLWLLLLMLLYANAATFPHKMLYKRGPDVTTLPRNGETFNVRLFLVCGLKCNCQRILLMPHRKMKQIYTDRETYTKSL